MKKILVLALVFVGLSSFAQAVKTYQYTQMSTIESVVPGGMGRSRMISTDEQGQIQENNLENFFSMVGINFSNVRNNDKVITDKINEYSKLGWELYSVNTGVYATDGKTGIFITRYLFRKPM